MMKMSQQVALRRGRLQRLVRVCVRILTQEADISREAGNYADAAEVSL